MSPMGWLSGSKKKQRELEHQEKEYILSEVVKAQRDWEKAHLAFQEAVGKDEVDFAIYTLEAAEKRYQIKLKEAKRIKLNVREYGHPLPGHENTVRGAGA